ncbi:MAG TPA: hypothetical protein PJ991_01550 [Kiritimatiellia bacterium]|nr:hypothetical protein [Kiritimatiellia bacterium]
MIYEVPGQSKSVSLNPGGGFCNNFALWWFRMGIRDGKRAMTGWLGRFMYRFGIHVGRVFFLALLLAAGCERISPDDRAYFEERERERNRRETLLRAVTSAIGTDEVIRRVRQSPGPEGVGDIDQWLESQISSLRGQIMFPRWSTTQRGSNKQEVHYQFVLIDEQNRMRKLYYAWDVDVLDMTVGPPRLAQLEEMDSPDRTIAQRNLRRVREHERHLD